MSELLKANKSLLQTNQGMGNSILENYFCNTQNTYNHPFLSGTLSIDGESRGY